MKKLKHIIGQAIIILAFNIGCSAMLVFGFLKNTIY